MLIERLQIDDGFLDGLDLTFADGLNVTIGGRGTGKTSIVELIRFCLAVPANTTESGRKALAHASSILGDGRVTVTLRDGDEKITVSRSQADEEPEATDSYDQPVIFSQTEIESVGLSAQARVRLLDSFQSADESTTQSAERLAAQIKSLTAEIRSVTREVEVLDAQLLQLPITEQELKALAEEEQAVTKLSTDIATKQQQIRAIATDATSLSVQAAIFQRAQKSVRSWYSELEHLNQSEPELESWPESAGPSDKLDKARKKLSQVTELLSEASVGAKEVLDDLATDDAAAARTKQEIDEKVRRLRKEMEAIQAGTGEVTKRGTLLREKLAGLKATAKLRQGKYEKLEATRDKRRKLLDDFEGMHTARFITRQKIAARLSKLLGPQIRIAVRQAAEYSEYVGAITSVLRGSNLKYNELAPLLATKLSPRELVEAVEQGDHDFIAAHASIARDRAVRIVGQMREAELENVLTVSVADDASFQLLDGADYKDVQQLSVGQRCTVVLPIILEHADRVLIVDQPEDHLDNAFIVETLIKAIRTRGTASQLLFTTHNANIPVLGDAKQVVVMKSNGHNGYVEIAGPLDEPAIVSAITTIMEGGKKAFETRARFYAEHQ